MDRVSPDALACPSCGRMLTQISRPVIDWTVGALTQVCKITIEPSGGILSDPLSPPSNAAQLLLCTPQDATSRTLTVEFQRGSTTDEAVFASTIQSIASMVDPRFRPTVEDVAPLVKIRMFDGMVGLQSLIPLVSAFDGLALRETDPRPCVLRHS